MHNGARLHDVSDATDSIPLRDLIDTDVAVSDQGYDSNNVRNWLKGDGIRPEIPTRSNAKTRVDVEATIYRKRCVGERVFAWLKTDRRIQSSFENHAVNFAAMWQLAIVMRYIRELLKS